MRDTEALAAGPAVIASAAGLATVGNAPIVLSLSPFEVQEGQLFNLPVATFTNGNPLESALDFMATIDWGDETAPESAVVEASGSNFIVKGTHTYIQFGTYTFTITVDVAGLGTLTDEATATVMASSPPPPEEEAPTLLIDAALALALAVALAARAFRGGLAVALAFAHATALAGALRAGLGGALAFALAAALAADLTALTSRLELAGLDGRAAAGEQDKPRGPTQHEFLRPCASARAVPAGAVERRELRDREELLDHRAHLAGFAVHDVANEQHSILLDDWASRVWRIRIGL